MASLVIMYKKLGDENYDKKHYKIALKHYTTALDFGKNKDTYKIYLNRCLANFKLEMFNDALDDACKASSLNPESARAWGRIGSCLCALNKKEESYIAFDKAYKLDPSNENYKKLSGRKEELENLINELKELKDKTPVLPENLIDKTPVLPEMKFSLMEGLMGPLFKKIGSQKLINLASSPTFRTEMLKYKMNPMEAMNNPIIMDLVSDVLKDL